MAPSDAGLKSYLKRSRNRCRCRLVPPSRRGEKKRKRKTTTTGRILSLSHKLLKVWRGPAPLIIAAAGRLQESMFFTRSINHFTMGWFGAGYPNKHQWNGIWWVVCDRLGQQKVEENSVASETLCCSGRDVLLGLRVRLRQGARLLGRPPSAACAGKLAGKLCGQAFKSAFDKVRARGA